MSQIAPASDPYLHDIIAEMERVDSSCSEAPPSSGEGARMRRREFIKFTGLAGSGLVLAFSLGGWPKGAYGEPGTGESTLNAYVRVAPDGAVILYSKAPEIGQGIKTAFPMILAEHMDADWNDVRVEQAPIDPEVYGRQSAGGSRSMPTGWEPLRRAGAVARAMLVAAAAAEWGIDPSQCSTEKSTVIHQASGRRLRYGAVAEKAARIDVPEGDAVWIKPRAQYTLLGTRVPGVDNPKIVTGQPLYGIDQVRPGMLYATYTKCPATGGRVAGANLDEIKRMPGVKDAFVIEGNGRVSELMPGVAIVAENTWAAIKAKRALKIKWDETQAAKDSWKGANAQARALASKPPAQILSDSGNVDSAFQSAAKVVEGFYAYPYLSHAPMEPQNCTAHVRDGGVEIWAPTQAPDRALTQIIPQLLGVPRSKVRIHQIRAGGGFGRRLAQDYMCEAVAISQRLGLPIKLQWTREDDFAHDFYRPGGFHQMKGAVDANGKLIGWSDHFITMSGDMKKPNASADIEVDAFPVSVLANARVGQTLMRASTPTGPWRAPRSNAIAWVIQSFYHELAVAAGRDHLEFLLENMGEPRWLTDGDPYALNTGRAAAVIKLAAEKAGWGRPMGKGRGLGLAFWFSHAAHVAEVADVSVDDNRKITVHKITVASDIGPIVNLSGAETQAQGAAIDGLSTMLGLEVTFEKGRAEQANFDHYPILRMAHAPMVEPHFIQSDYPPTGFGEPVLPPVAPAVCNAIFTATGYRIRTLPVMHENFAV
jgi:isoquinoline 1-oxidoreductase subunit beta